MVTEAGGNTKNNLHSTLKRGDCFGDEDIIKNQQRSQTVTVVGQIPCGMLIINKEDFFIIQTPMSTKEERFKFLQNKVNFLKVIDYPVNKLNNLDRQYLFSIYYRTGKTIICFLSKMKVI